MGLVKTMISVTARGSADDKKAIRNNLGTLVQYFTACSVVQALDKTIKWRKWKVGRRGGIDREQKLLFVYLHSISKFFCLMRITGSRITIAGLRNYSRKWIVL